VASWSSGVMERRSEREMPRRSSAALVTSEPAVRFFWSLSIPVEISSAETPTLAPAYENFCSASVEKPERAARSVMAPLVETRFETAEGRHDTSAPTDEVRVSKTLRPAASLQSKSLSTKPALPVSPARIPLQTASVKISLSRRLRYSVASEGFGDAGRFEERPFLKPSR
jgi:hypothetical protein